MTELLTSPLHERWVELGAKFSEFGGWSMPLEYAGGGGGGIVGEHKATRAAAGLFDVSHLGKISVSGTGAAEFLNSCFTADLHKITPGQAQYTLCCINDGDNAGGVTDDLIAYYKSAEEVFLIPNAANTTEVARLLMQAAPEGIEVTNQHRDFAVLAVQGPSSQTVVEQAGFEVAGLAYMAFNAHPDAGGTTVCRTGYTGEQGYELVVPIEHVPAVFDRVWAVGADHGLVAAGLGARDTLRTEMGYPLHGQDISPQITPVQARLGWAIGWSKPAFWGREALLAEKEAGARRQLWGIRARGRGIPRPHMQVVSADDSGVAVGEVTSGTFSPTLRTGIGLALLAAGTSAGDVVGVDVRGRTEPFEVVKPPFVTSKVR